MCFGFSLTLAKGLRGLIVGNRIANEGDSWVSSHWGLAVASFPGLCAQRRCSGAGLCVREWTLRCQDRGSVCSANREGLSRSRAYAGPRSIVAGDPVERDYAGGEIDVTLR